MSNAPNLTDRSALNLHRARARRRPALFLHQEVAFGVQERLQDVNKSFTAPLTIGHVTEPFRAILPGSTSTEDSATIAADGSKHDLVLHLFGLHWADDPVGQLVQSRIALMPDGLFLGVMFGGSTLAELRSAISEAETQLTGGLSPRILPMADVRDLGSILQRAGFALPVADCQTFRVRYPDLRKLVSDLRGMGETNALAQRHRAIPPRDLFRVTEEIYRRHFSEDGYLTATFEVVYLTGWAPDATQPKPLRPGSAKARLADALGVPEVPLRRD